MSQIRKFVAMSLLPLVALASPWPAITDPPILQRQVTDPAFIGYVNTHGIFSPEFCVTSDIWTESDQYGICCPATIRSCVMPTACSGGSFVIWADAYTGTCTNTLAPLCVTDIVYNDINDPSPVNWVGCARSRLPWTLYRTTPIIQTTPETTAASSSPSSPVITITPTPPPTPSKSHSSKAWIAGVAVGAFGAIALIAALLLFFLRRKSKPAPPGPYLQPTFTPIQPSTQPPMAGVQALGMPTPQKHMSVVGSPPPQYPQDNQGNIAPVAGVYYPQQQTGMYQPQAASPTSQPELMPPTKGTAELQGRY